MLHCHAQYMNMAEVSKILAAVSITNIYFLDENYQCEPSQLIAQPLNVFFYCYSHHTKYILKNTEQTN